MGRTTNILSGALASVAVMQAAPVQAQYMPHLDPNTYILATMGYGQTADPCMGGTAMPDRKVDEARVGSLATMQAYYAAAQGGTEKSAAFLLDEDTKWQSGTTVVGQSGIDGQADALAAAGLSLETEPLLFYRGGTGATALGQWAVLDGQGQVAGVYTGFFKRKRGEWLLRELTLSGADDVVAPIAQFCREAGDVTEHRLTSASDWRDNAKEAITKAEEKHAKAVEDAAEAQAKADAKPSNRRLAKAAVRAARNRDKRAEQIEDRKENLAKAIEKYEEAEKDADALKRLTGPARNAMAFRTLAEEDEEEETANAAE